MGEHANVRRAVLVAAMLGLAEQAAAETLDIRTAVGKAREGGATAAYAAPPESELVEFEKAFAQLLRIPGAAGPAPRGFELASASSARGEIRIVRETAQARAGGGVYLLAGKAGLAPVLVLQAPHSFFDRHTGEIAVSLFESSDAFACFVNTVRRKNAPDGSADVAHSEVSRFHRATRALADALPGSVFVQLHGFEASKRSGHAATADFVLADGRPGSESRRPLLDAAARSFRAIFGEERVAVHGRDTSELGALTNVQGQFLNSRSRGRFLHIEMSAAMREQAVKDRAAAARLRDAVMAAVKEAKGGF